MRTNRRRAPKGQRIRRMTNDLYAQRRRPVIEVLYMARRWLREKAITLPRIELRVTEATSQEHRRVLGVATLGRCEIFIAETAFNTPHPLDLAATVLHEVVHAVTGFGHDDRCPLMAPTNSHQFRDIDELKAHFVKYF